MNRILVATLILVIFEFVLLTPSIINEKMIARAQIINLPPSENGTRLILNMKNHTQTLVNAATNETISVENFTVYQGNATANETNKMIIPGKTSNTSINENLSERLSKLAK
jgi:hypothetical protein